MVYTGFVVLSEPSSRLDQTNANIRIYICLITKLVNWSHFKYWLQLTIYFGLSAWLTSSSRPSAVPCHHAASHSSSQDPRLYIMGGENRHFTYSSSIIFLSPIPPFGALAIPGHVLTRWGFFFFLAALVVAVVLVFFQLWVCTFHWETCRILVITALTKGPSSYCRHPWSLECVWLLHQNTTADKLCYRLDSQPRHEVDTHLRSSQNMCWLNFSVQLCRCTFTTAQLLLASSSPLCLPCRKNRFKYWGISVHSPTARRTCPAAIGWSCPTSAQPRE